MFRMLGKKVELIRYRVTYMENEQKMTANCVSELHKNEVEQSLTERGITFITTAVDQSANEWFNGLEFDSYDEALVVFEKGIGTPQEQALHRINGKCSAAIFSGVTVGDKHYKLTATAQGNLATAQAKVDGGAKNVIYAADNEEPTLHTAEQITAISDAAYKWGVVNTSYYAKLQKWIACETDKAVLQSIDYGLTLPDNLMHELSELLDGAGINLADYAGLLG